jgi:UDP-N-acetylglucosamine 3-dehydrogenase
MTRLRVGVVGYGVMGSRHARVFAALDREFDVVGAYDPRVDAIPVFLRRFVNEDTLVEACDVVVVSSPIERHRESASRALVKRRHVLVEKPIAATWREASALVGRAAAADARLFVGHSERFHPVTRALADELRGARITSMHFRRVAVGTPRDAALREPRADALLNLAVHDIDLAAYLADDRIDLSSASERGALCTLDIVGKKGWRGSIEAGRVGENPERAIVVETEATTYRGDLRNGSLTATDRATKSERQIVLRKEEPLLAQAAALAAAFRGEKQALARGEDGARAVAVAEQALARLEAPAGAAEKL